MTAPALAAAAPDDATQITVIGIGQAERVDQSGQSIAIVGLDEIRSVQGPDITRVLQRLPGVTITRNGGLGAFTGVRLRGAESEQTLVLIDGARVADVSSPGGGFDFGTLLTSNIEKIELLRGSNSVVWGSDAIGGVVAVTTRQLEGIDASAEYGAYNTFTGAAAAGFSSGGLSIALNGGYADSDGFSQLASDTEKDGFNQWQAGGRLAYDVGSGLSVFADGRFARSKVGLDFSFANDYVQTTRQVSGRTGVKYVSEVLDLTAAYSIADTHRGYESPFFAYEYNGEDQRVDLDGRWRLIPALALVFGANHQWSHYDGTFDTRQADNQSSGHALLDYSEGGLNLAAGVRLDHHSRFGDAWTFGANGSYAIGGGWRLRGSYGEGFKAPTLYQLFSFAGNVALRPERSHSYEAGIEHGDRNGPLHFAATVFRRESRDLIDYDVSANGGFGGYNNVARARATGFELEGDVHPTRAIALHAAYSYVRAENRLTDRDLARRPHHAVSVAADWTNPLHGPLNGLTLGADVRLVSDSFDDVANTVRLDGYAVAGIHASLPVTKTIELFGRVENLTDEKYQTVAAFNTPGRSAYGGMRARF
ncbi:MAG: TonB-dependent receptor [Novosphingobium sp.]